MKKFEYNGKEYDCCTDIEEVKETERGAFFKKFNSISDLLKAWVGKITLVDEDGRKRVKKLEDADEDFDYFVGKPSSMFHTENDYNSLSITLFKLEDVDPRQFRLEFSFEFDHPEDNDNFFMEDESGQIWFVQVDFD